MSSIDCPFCDNRFPDDQMGGVVVHPQIGEVHRDCLAESSTDAIEGLWEVQR